MFNTPRRALIWVVVFAATLGPLMIAAQSPLLEWRQPVYIIAGFAGVVALALLFIQPLLGHGLLPGVPLMTSKRIHGWCGGVLVSVVVVHVGGLWITSPPDVLDVLLFRSPTPFSIWAVLAMWGIFASAGYVALRRRLGLQPRIWRRVHLTLAGFIVISSVVHAVLIEGTMGQISKIALCALTLAALAKVYLDVMQRSRRKKN